MLAARGDGGRDLVGLRGAEHEDGPGRRLLDGLQERVERLVGDLVGFVDNENFVAVASRLVAHVFAQFAHFIDAAVGSRVDFDDVHRPAAGDFQTTGAHPARRRRRAFHAVQAARQNPRHGGLPCPALPRKNIAVSDAVLRNGVFERGLDVLLVDHLPERLRPVFSSDDLVHGAGESVYLRTSCQAPGNPRHTNRTATVASFRTWRGLQPPVARSPGPDKHLS